MGVMVRQPQKTLKAADLSNSAPHPLWDERSWSPGTTPPSREGHRVRVNPT